MTGYNAAQCAYVALDFMQVNNDSSLTEALHGWGTVSTKASDAASFTALVPEGLQATLGAAPVPHVLRARCGSAPSGPYLNPVGNISSVFTIRARDLSTSSIVGRLGLPATYSYGVDVPLNLSVSRVPAVGTYPFTLSLIATGSSPGVSVTLTFNTTDFETESISAHRFSTRGAPLPTPTPNYFGTNLTIATLDDLINKCGRGARDPPPVPAPSSTLVPPRSFPAGVTLTAAIAVTGASYLSTAPSVTVTRPPFFIATNATGVRDETAVKSAFLGGGATVTWTPTPFTVNPGGVPATTDVSVVLRSYRNGAAMASAALAGQPDPAAWLTVGGGRSRLSGGRLSPMCPASPPLRRSPRPSSPPSAPRRRSRSRSPTRPRPGRPPRSTPASTRSPCASRLGAALPRTRRARPRTAT